MNRKLCRLTCNDVQYYLLTSDKDGGLALLLTDTVNAWHGHVGKDSLTVDNVEIEDYEMQTRNALMGEFNSGFEYELKEATDKDNKSIQLIWKKVIEKDQIKFQLGSLSMEPVKQLKEALSTMFDHMIQANNELRQQMVVLKADCDRLAADRTDALKKLEASVNIKEETEKTLYAKFAVVLNEKKAKLRHLKAQLEAAEVSATGVVNETKQKKRADRISASLAEEEVSKVLDKIKHQSTTDDLKVTETETQESQASDATAVAVCSKKTSNAESTHVLDFMLEEPESAVDEDLPAGPKRNKLAGRADKQQKSDVDTSGTTSVPRMLSTTGTTHTPTTSCDRQRWHEKHDKSDESKDSKVTEQTKSSRSADTDDLIGDME